MDSPYIDDSTAATIASGGPPPGEKVLHRRLAGPGDADGGAPSAAAFPPPLRVSRGTGPGRQYLVGRGATHSPQMTRASMAMISSAHHGV